MARYMVERIFPDGLAIPVTDDGAATCLGVVDRNAELGVTWVHSYVSDDKRKTFCIYDGPDPGIDPSGSGAQRPAHREHHAHKGPRPLLLQVSRSSHRKPERKRNPP
jgi:Nickel responsive protein SCO4226-like